MVFPPVPPRMKQFGYLIGLGLDAGQVRSFMEIAIDARQGKIVDVIRATVLLGDDVFDVQGSQWRVVFARIKPRSVRQSKVTKSALACVNPCGSGTV